MIMGKNFFGVEEAIKHFRINPTEQELIALSRVPFSECVLEQQKDTHLLLAVFPLAIVEIRDRVDRTLFRDQDDKWYYRQYFAKEQGSLQWHLIRGAPVDKSMSKNWREQQLLIEKSESVPSAQVVTYTAIGSYLVSGDRLFEHIYVHTASVDSDGRRISVGGFGIAGLTVGNYCGGPYGDALGIASERRPDI